MTVASSEQKSFLVEQKIQTTKELEEKKGQVKQLQQSVDAYHPAVEQAVMVLERKLSSIISTRIEQEQAKARSESLFTALSLKPIFKNTKVLVIVWLVILFAIFWFKHSIVLLMIFAGIYTAMVRKAMTRAATEKNKTRHDAMKSLALGRLSLMQFTDKESGDSAHPYVGIAAPRLDNQPISSDWRIDKRFGNMLNASFIAIYSSQDTKKQYALVHVPTEGQPQIVDINANTTGWEWPLHVEILQALGLQAKEEIKSIQQYAEHAEEWVRALQQQKLLEQRLLTIDEVKNNWSDIAIDEPTLDRILKLVDMFKAGRKPTPKGILLYGPPGTGKTLIARKLAKQANCHFEAVNIADLKASYIGQTAPKVQELWKRCRDKGPTILFVDECESAFAKRGGVDNDSFGNELVQAFISEWDGFNQAAGQVFVIAATNRRDILDTAVVSRFTATVEIGLPNDKARFNILKNEFKQADIDIEISNELVTETAGMSGRDIHTLVATVMAEHYGSKVDAKDVLKEIQKVRGKGSTQVKGLTWDDIILPQNTLNEFQNLGKELRNAERLAAMGISTPKGILLYGPPGTGKTQIARVLAGQSGLSFMAATTSDLKANFIGQSGSKVKQLFEQARSQAPCILFIDEIDIVAGARTGANDSFTEEIVGQLLQELDGVATKAGQVFLLAASNHPDNIDSAVLSRLERKIEIGLPDQAARAKIIALLLNSKPVNFDVEAAANHLATLTEGKSGRDLNSLVTRATRRAVNRVMQSGEDLENLTITLDDFSEEGVIETQ